jgi:hypothetical protein
MSEALFHVLGHFELSSDHHTPGESSTEASTTPPSRPPSIDASAVVWDQDQVAVGLTNKIPVLRFVASGRVQTSAEAVYQGRTHPDGKLPRLTRLAQWITMARI